MPPRTGVGIVPRWRRTVTAEVGDRWRDGAASLLTMGFNHTDACTTCWHGKLTCPILDCLETVTGLCPRWRTVCESVGQRLCDGASCLLTLGIRSLRCLHTRRRGWLTRPISDCRETVMGLCRLPHTVGERVGKRWRDGPGGLAILDYPVTTMLAHTSARVVDAADFRLSRNGNGAEAAGSHSLRACREAMARRRRLNAYLGFGRTDIVCWREVDVTRFSTVEKRRWRRVTLISKP